MISLEQIKLLEQKIERTLALIVELTNENKTLKSRMGSLMEENGIFTSENQSLTDTNRSLRGENDTLRSSLAKYQGEQAQIEQAVLQVIDRLETVETAVMKTMVNRAESTSLGVPPLPKSEVRVPAPEAPPVLSAPRVEAPAELALPAASAFGLSMEDADEERQDEAEDENESADDLFGTSSGLDSGDSKPLDIF
jgi:hypothetical protein